MITSLKDAITIAIDHEHRVRDHYRSGTALILDPRGKSIFEVLAREEQGHVDYLESRLAEWRKTGTVENMELTTLLPPTEWIEQARQRFAGGHACEIAVQAELDLLKTALELERTTSAFYRELVATLPPEHRPLFSRFLEIEQGHVLIVQAEIDALAGHGHWLDVMEFRLEAG